MKNIVILTFVLNLNAWAFSPLESFVDLVEKDEDVMVLVEPMVSSSHLKPEYDARDKNEAIIGLTVHSEDGKIFEYRPKFGAIYVNKLNIYEFRRKDEYFDKAEKNIKGEKGETYCKRQPSDDFPVILQNVKSGSYSLGVYSVPNVKDYVFTMPISEIKDQKIYSVYKGKKFWVDLNTTIYLRDMSIILSKKTKKKLWENFLKNDRGFAEYYKKTFECYEKMLNAEENNMDQASRDCAKKDGVNKVLRFWGQNKEYKPLIYNGVTLDTYQVDLNKKNLHSESETCTFFCQFAILPTLSETEYFEYRPFNLPFVYGKLSDNDRVIVYIKGPSKEFLKFSPESKSTYGYGLNRVTFVYYNKSWHPLTTNEIYPDSTR